MKSWIKRTSAELVRMRLRMSYNTVDNKRNTVNKSQTNCLDQVAYGASMTLANDTKDTQASVR